MAKRVGVRSNEIKLPSQTKNYEHTPVLLAEAISYLQPGAGKNIVDATLGGAGYSQAILGKIGSNGKLLSIDLDYDAVEHAKLKIKDLKLKNWVIAHGNFAKIDRIIRNHAFPPPDGIVADLGLSSHELDQAGRGMSFQRKEPLDMRFNQAEEREDARFLLKNRAEHELEKIFREYGEEKFSRKIAKKIQEHRSKNLELRHTTDLYRLIQEALPKPVKHRAGDSARRIFQALRIAVNHELENLQEFLPKAFDLLVPGGRLVVVSFHSLEDRLAKQFFTGLSRGCVCPPDFPECRCGRNPQARQLTRKPVQASDEEIERNPRAKPAKLRAVVKL